MDTDASGHWHHTAALRLIEWAESILLERLGILEDVYGRGLPRVHIELDFRSPIRFNELAEIGLEVVDLRRSSITYRAEIACRGEVCAAGSIVAVIRDASGRAAPWPDDHRDRLLTAGPQAPLLA